MVKISACVIAKNEAMCISRCLQSVKGIADEMLVADTGSTDQTVSIAEQLGARVLYYPWRNDFSAARNYVLAHATGDWIIFLDADEYIPGDKAKNVRPVIESIHGKRTFDAIKCIMNNLEDVKGPLRSANPTIRIFRNSKAIRYEGLVHECIVRRGKRKINVANVKKDIFTVCHTGYTNETINEKIRRNAALLQEELKRGIVRRYTYCYLSDSYLNTGEYETAIEYALKAIQAIGQIDRDIDYKPYVILIKSMTLAKTHEEKEVALLCDEAGRKFPGHPEIWLQQGLYYRSIGRLEKALSLLLKAVAANACSHDFKRCNDFYASSVQAYLNIAQLYELKNQSAAALDYYVKVLQQKKFSQTGFRGLIQLIRRQDPAEVIYFLNTLYNIAAEADVRFLVDYLSRLKVINVLSYYQQILREKFADKTLNGLVLLASGKFDEVFPVFVDSFLHKGQYDMEMLAVISLLIAGRPELTDLLGPQLHQSFRKIIAVYFQTGADNALSADDLPHFFHLVREMAYMGLDTELHILLLAVKQCLSGKDIETIGNVFLKHSFFHHALDIYLPIIRQASLAPSGLLYFEAGYCCYKLKDFAGAADWFSRALQAGYRKCHIFEFLAWSYAQCTDVLLKEKFKVLQASYGM
jgi:glycosyltransferase involved in cell wall biosynthesis